MYIGSRDYVMYKWALYMLVVRQTEDKCGTIIIIELGCDSAHWKIACQYDFVIF